MSYDWAMLTVEAHPLLELSSFVTTFPRPLAELEENSDLTAGLALEAVAPLQRSDEVKKAVRDLLRHGGFKPAGRSKPASEYLVRAAGDGYLQPINPAVDACNVVSLHSGLPISVVDLGLVTLPLRVAICEAGTSYVFNPAGQEIDISGLLSLFDAEGPCAGPVKDSQRTKTHDGTLRTLSLVWGTVAMPRCAAAAAAWYRKLLAGVGATTED